MRGFDSAFGSKVAGWLMNQQTFDDLDREEKIEWRGVDGKEEDCCAFLYGAQVYISDAVKGKYITPLQRRNKGNRGEK